MSGEPPSPAGGGAAAAAATHPQPSSRRRHSGSAKRRSKRDSDGAPTDAPCPAISSLPPHTLAPKLAAQRTYEVDPYDDGSSVSSYGSAPRSSSGTVPPAPASASSAVASSSSMQTTIIH